MIDNHSTSDSVRGAAPSRRTVIQGVAWSIPVVVASAAASAAVASVDPPVDPGIVIESWFGVSYYKTARELQIDSCNEDRLFTVGNLNPGDQISNARVRVLISKQNGYGNPWPQLAWDSLSGTWTAPAYVGDRTVGGREYRIYETVSTALPVTATGSTASVPMAVVFRTNNAPDYSGGGDPVGGSPRANMPWVIVERLVTVTRSTGGVVTGAYTGPTVTASYQGGEQAPNACPS